MANPEHVAKLKEGVRAWNEWRSQNPRLLPDLRRADFTVSEFRGIFQGGSKLGGVNFGSADLLRANLSRSDLAKANLSGAKLRRADLSGANLSGADLSVADLFGASLGRADLSGAKLFGADLRETNLCDANAVRTSFTATETSRTQWCGMDLSNALDLESIAHVGPSSVGLDTLVTSKGRIPDVFLRGCGLSDWEIEATKLYDPSLREDQRTAIAYEIIRLQGRQPIMFHSVFISYSTADEAFARKLHGDLQNAGVRCWFAPHDMASGKKVHEQIDRAIQAQDRLLLVLSAASMASEWVKTEIANARAKEREQKRQVLFPIALVPFDEVRKWRAFDADIGKDSAREVREYFIPDFSNWKDENAYKLALDRLLKDLRARDEPTRE